MRSPLLALMILALALTGCPGDDDVIRADDGWLARGDEAARDTTYRAVRLAGRPLTLDVADGSITVVGADVDEATFEFERVARAGSASAAQRRLERITIDESGDEAGYEFRVDRERQTTVHARATVPRDAELVIRLENGRVSLSGLSGKVDVRGRAGTVEAEDLRTHSINARNEQGQQRIAFSDVPPGAEIRLRTAVGNVDVELPAGASLQMSAEAATGRIAVEGLPAGRERFEQRQAWTRYRGRIGGGEGMLMVQVDVGNIRLRGGLTDTADE